MNQAPAYELRVLSGEQCGATSAVCLGDTLRIGRDWSSDVVLQQADDSAALLNIDANGYLALNVEAGQCMIDGGGAQLQAGEHASLAPYTPFTVGSVRIAVGRIGASQWAALFDDAGSNATGDETSDETSDQALPQAPVGIWQAAILFVQRLTWVKRLLLSGAVLVSASAGALTLVWAMSAASQPLSAQAENLRQALTHAGFSALHVEARDNGLVVTGRLDTSEQGYQLEQLLAKFEGGKMARSEVWINEQVTADVGDVYRLNHIAAEVQSAGPGIVHVQTHEEDTAALEKVKASALKVPGLQELVAVNNPPAAASCGETVIHDPNKLIVAIVPGDPAYVVTADGTRYFEGAMLPTGYLLKAIMPDHIQMECNGSISDLKL